MFVCMCVTLCSCVCVCEWEAPGLIPEHVNLPPPFVTIVTCHVSGSESSIATICYQDLLVSSDPSVSGISNR